MMKLITDEQRAQLLANGRQSLDNNDFDPAPVVKLFTPDAGATSLYDAYAQVVACLGAEPLPPFVEA